MPTALKTAAYEIYSRYFTHSTLVEGTLRGSDTPCRCLMAMPRNGPFENYLLRRIYGDSFRRTRVERTWIPSLRGWAGTLPPTVDFGIAALPARWEAAFSRCCSLKSPAIVHQAIDLAGDWSDFRRRLHRKKREMLNRFMKGSPYVCRISSKPEDFDHFYHRMYVAHSEKQFQSAARVDPYASVKRYFQKGFLLILKEGDEDVAGSVCYVRDDELVFHRGGVLDGNEVHVRNGAQTASYVSMICQAKSMNLARLDLGHSRAFFDDGVYRHKREWGASVSVDPDLESWMYVFDPGASKACAAFLRQNPLIVQTSEGLMGYAVAEARIESPELDEVDLDRRFRAPGLGGMLVLYPGARAPMPYPFRSTGDGEHLTTREVQPSFAQA
jgi:hypothetical protein